MYIAKVTKTVTYSRLKDYSLFGPPLVRAKEYEF